MPDTTDRRTQYLACFLIVLALSAIGVADKANWRDMANAGNTVLGFGGGLLTGKALSQTTTKGGGDIKNVSEPSDALKNATLGLLFVAIAFSNILLS